MTVTIANGVVTAEIVRTPDEWAEIIRAEMARTAESIVLTGQYLIDAKADVGHGAWLPMLRKIGINDQVARQYMAVGSNPALANPSNCLDLPPASRTLYELSRLAPEAIASGIESGDVHPGMTIKDAKGYAAEVADRTAPANVNTDTGEINPEPKPTENRDTDIANGARNDLAMFANYFIKYTDGIAKNIEHENLPPAALDHIANALRDQLDRINKSTTRALAALEGDQS